jgi:hypothetical protein
VSEPQDEAEPALHMITRVVEGGLDLAEEYSDLARCLRTDPMRLLEILDRFQLYLYGDTGPDAPVVGFLCPGPHIDEADGPDGPTLLLPFTLAADGGQEMEIACGLRGTQERMRAARIIDDLVAHEWNEHG